MENAAEPTFNEHVRAFTNSLREKYGLKLSGATLESDFVRVVFSEGDPRDKLVSVLISFPDEKNPFRKFARTKSFFLEHYIPFCGVDLEEVYPYWKAKNGLDYRKSPFHLLASVSFLNLYGERILTADAAELERFGKYFHEMSEKYTDQFR